MFFSFVLFIGLGIIKHFITLVTLNSFLSMNHFFVSVKILLREEYFIALVTGQAVFFVGVDPTLMLIDANFKTEHHEADITSVFLELSLPPPLVSLEHRDGLETLVAVVAIVTDLVVRLSDMLTQTLLASALVVALVAVVALALMLDLNVLSEHSVAAPGKCALVAEHILDLSWLSAAATTTATSATFDRTSCNSCGGSCFLAARRSMQHLQMPSQLLGIGCGKRTLVAVVSDPFVLGIHVLSNVLGARRNVVAQFALVLDLSMNGLDVAHKAAAHKLFAALVALALDAVVLGLVVYPQLVVPGGHVGALVAWTVLGAEAMNGAPVLQDFAPTVGGEFAENAIL